ncbi:ATP-grasp domain-containing protein [Mangrovihabitans endophyticus]|uniref:ATP-grasp domain-containing protein n=1 Tax=Mangrovihabitans endophyticus TaxID=1751298 RepID=A0A8J3BWC9_9ACTN|nr:ATP-grasp domain-containing protein [Mangrovihabitans endophyticus]GGK73836.1 ATP-grasp domain-containing protein [Mangrovihabitans endophyticus]
MSGSGGKCIVVVDAYSSARRLAPLFAEAGYDCVHVQSDATVPAVYATSFEPDQFAANLVHGGDLRATVAAVDGYAPRYVLAGMETGVEVADALSEALGLPTNGTALSAARRDKYRMIEAVKSAGLPAAAQVASDDLDEVLAWYADVGGRVVVKPPRSAGSEGVAFCTDAEQTARAFHALRGRRNALNGENDTVVVQEYLYGAEYYVNTVSRDGRHHVCDLWQRTHVTAHGVLDLLDSTHLMPRSGPEQDRLVEYTFAVLDALGIRHGPAHAEVKLTPDGPRLVEVGARLCGADLPQFAREVLGTSQLDWTVLAATDRAGFHHAAGKAYQLRGGAAAVALLAPEDGWLVRYRGLAALHELESVQEVRIAVHPGQRIRRTINDFGYPAAVYLRHEVAEVVRRDYRSIRQIDGPALYEIESDREEVCS